MRDKAKYPVSEQFVHESYSKLAKASESITVTPENSSCCGNTSQVELSMAPSFGCVNQFENFVQPKSGEIIVDLGSGLGHDILKIAKHDPTITAIGVDFSEDMILQAEKKAEQLDLTNVQLIEAHIGNIPLESQTVDKVISNCVINLVDDKFRVFEEIYRLLKPGGKTIIADMITTSDLSILESIPTEMFCACVGGSVSYEEYLSSLTKVGFSSVEHTKISSGTYHHEELGFVKFDNVVFVAEK